MNAAEFAQAIRARATVVGYWVVLDAPPAAERIARLGYDYVCFDAQHGLLGSDGILSGLTAVDAGGGAVGIVRVEANDPTPIGRALDAGAAGVIVPLIDTAEQAAAAVSAARYPPVGRRSYGPIRSGLRIGPRPPAAHDATVVLAMIETPQGLAEVDAICATPGLDGVFVGPSDLTFAVGGAYPGDPEVAEEFETAVARIRTAAQSAGVTAGIYVHDGGEAARRLAEGFTLVSIANDLAHLERAAAQHLAAARPPRRV